MENKKIMANVEDCIDTMKKKDFHINVKCTQFEALTVALGAVAVATAVHLIVSTRKKAKLKKKITKKVEKAYAKKFAALEAELRADYEAKLAEFEVDEAEEVVVEENA